MRNRRLAAALALGALVALARPAAADFAAGVAAYDSGDYATAFREWLPLAENGDAAAQRNIGHLYRKGLGVPQDLVKAVEWYRQAAEFGLARAQANLASMYLRGDGVPQDYAEAAKWFERSALQGHAIAQYNLALMYERGIGVERNEPKALAWYYNAARAGHEGASQKLATMVMPPSREEAVPPEEPAGVAAPPASTGATTAPVTTAPGAESVALTSPQQVPEGEPAAAAPPAETSALPAEAGGSQAPPPLEWKDPDATSPDEEPTEAAGPSEATAATESASEEDEPGFGKAALRAIFGFNSEISSEEGIDRGPVRQPDDDRDAGAVEEEGSAEEAPAESSSDEPGTDTGAAVEDGAQGDTLTPSEEETLAVSAAVEPGQPDVAPENDGEDPRESAALASDEVAPQEAIEPSEPLAQAVTVATMEPSPSATVETVPETATDEATQADESYSLLRWVLLAGAQSSGDFAVRGGGGNAGGASSKESEAGDDDRAAPREHTVEPMVAAQPAAGMPALAPDSALPVADRGADAADPEAVAEAHLEAARAGDTRVQYALGRMYFDGTGVAQDELQAYMWWALAADGGHAEAAKSFRLLAADMTHAQLAAGEILVDEWLDHR